MVYLTTSVIFCILVVVNAQVCDVLSCNKYFQLPMIFQAEWMITLNKWMDRCAHIMDGWMDGWMDCMHGWMDRWMDGCMDECHKSMDERCMDRWRDGWMERQLNKWMDGLTDIQMDIQMDGQMERDKRVWLIKYWTLCMNRIVGK